MKIAGVFPLQDISPLRNNYYLGIISSSNNFGTTVARLNTRMDMKKDNFFTQAKFQQKLFYPKKYISCDESCFATKQCKMYSTKSMSNIRLPHIYIGKK